MKRKEKMKVLSYASIHRVEGYIFQMESSVSVHTVYSARHKVENRVSKVQERERLREREVDECTESTESTSVKAISL